MDFFLHAFSCDVYTWVYAHSPICLVWLTALPWWVCCLHLWSTGISVGCYSFPQSHGFWGSIPLSSNLSSISFIYWAIPWALRGFLESIEGIHDKILRRNQFKEEKVYFSSQFKSTVHHDGKSKLQVPEAAGSTSSTVRKRRVKMLMVHWLFPSYGVQDPSPRRNSPYNIPSNLC